MSIFKIKIINGANINILGIRETQIYGKMSLENIIDFTQNKLLQYIGPNFDIDWNTSNHEGEIVEFIHNTKNEKYDLLVINPGGYSHTSVAILDALKILDIPIIETHISNLYNRETYRQTLLTASVASMIISGAGKDGYYLGILKYYFEWKKHN
jgi:3-dehydroquinate dehydratase-2